MRDPLVVDDRPASRETVADAARRAALHNCRRDSDGRERGPRTETRSYDEQQIDPSRRQKE